MPTQDRDTLLWTAWLLTALAVALTAAAVFLSTRDTSLPMSPRSSLPAAAASART